MKRTTEQKAKKIVFAGGPGTGKSTLIDELEKHGHQVMKEVSREIVREAREKGVEHLFISDPLAFSDKLLEKRKAQFQKAENSEHEHVFIDRGIPEITAYLDHQRTDYPSYFSNANKQFIYDQIFIFPVWKDIFEQDEIRYETLHHSKEIQEHLIRTYRSIGYDLIEMPRTDTVSRIDFIMNKLGHE
jgi:predicted ATPase